MGFNPFYEKFDFNGQNLIEASAGTGKTYGITAIYLRLILEKKLQPPDILTVTFTVDATEELKRRIRKILKDSFDLLNGQGGDCDESLKKYLEGLLKDGKGDNKSLVARLREALISLDDAPIYTIHKFCKRILSENPVETGTPLNASFSSDEGKFIDEIVFYVYRKWLYREKETVASVFLEEFVKGEKIKNFAEKYLSSINPQLDIENINIKALNEAYQKLAKEFKNAKKRISAGNEATHFREYFHSKAKGFRLLEATKKVADKKGFRDRHSAVADAYDEFMLKARLYITGRVLETLKSADNYVKSVKTEENLLGFSDLIRLVFFAVFEGRLKNNAFKALLIDEFQDTDFLQVYIFQKLFEGKASFFIGDPKQSIYSFRSADLNAYFYATSKIKNRFSLDVCYRSTKELIEAFNNIFSQSNFFMDRRIEYSEVSALDSPKVKVVLNNGSKDLNFYILKDVSNKEGILPVVSSEIEYLLGSASIEENNKSRPIEPRDICILVRNNSDAEAVREHLSKNGIKCTLTTTKSVFETEEAKSIMIILRALNNYSSAVNIKSALMLNIFHKTIEDISKDDFISLYKEKFANYRKYLNKRGIMAAFLHIFNEEKSREFVLNKPNGERIYTNYLHILEILQDASKHENLNIERIIQYLNARLNDPSLEQEEGELRLESDENALKVSTIHKSKGLEFPVVFLLYFAAKSPNKRAAVPYSFEFDENSGKHFVKVQNNQNSNESEYSRLLYVALTRAMSKCYLFDYKRRGLSITNRLLYGGAKKPDEIVGNLKTGFGDIAMIETSARDFKKVESTKILAQSGRLKFRRFEGEKKRLYRLSSYSSIARSMDISYEEELIADEGYDIFSQTSPELPAGAAVGSLIHKILEEIEFNLRDEDLKSAVSKALSGYSEKASEYAFNMIKNVLNAPLRIDGGDFRLRDLKRDKRMSEMKFFISLNDLNKFIEALKRIFKRRKDDDFCERLESLKPDEMKRYLIGFIDLVFEFNGSVYVIDWKTNYLGNEAGDYDYYNLRREIAANDYFLQFSIYQLAVYKYIKSLNSNLKTGDAIYIFMRGFDPENNRGIYRYSFSEDELNGLARYT